METFLAIEKKLEEIIMMSNADFCYQCIYIAAAAAAAAVVLLYK